MSLTMTYFSEVSARKFKTLIRNDNPSPFVWKIYLPFVELKRAINIDLNGRFPTRWFKKKICYLVCSFKVECINFQTCHNVNLFRVLVRKKMFVNKHGIEINVRWSMAHMGWKSIILKFTLKFIHTVALSVQHNPFMVHKLMHKTTYVSGLKKCM